MASSMEAKTEETPVSSLIDVVFLLIMFFVATANIDQEGFDESVRLAKAKHMQKLTKVSPSLFPLSINALKEVKYNGIPVTESELNVLTSWARLHADEYGDAAVVMLRVDENAKLGLVHKVVEAVQAGGLGKIKITAKLIGEGE